MTGGYLTSERSIEAPDWEGALCREMDPELFFPAVGVNPYAVRAVCSMCPLRLPCLDFAIKNDEQFGIWGGTSYWERRALQGPASPSERRRGDRRELVRLGHANGLSTSQIAVQAGVSETTVKVWLREARSDER